MFNSTAPTKVGKTLHLGAFRLHTDSHALLRLPNGQYRTPKPTVAGVDYHSNFFCLEFH